MSKLLPKNADRDFTASAFIVKNGKVLLVEHRKLDKWLQPGGHVEENELPHETAKREALEETGLKLKIVKNSDSSYDDKCFDLPKPLDANVHRIREGHWHCDFAYLAKPLNSDIEVNKSEVKNVKWFSKEEIESSNYQIPENVVSSAIKAIDEEFS